MIQSGRVKEIDGLRAIALLGVLLYHSKLTSGGFLGVDIFFVISGYVITLSLCKKLSQGSFSFFEFIVRRSLRLLPALVAVLFSTNVLCLFLFTEQNRKTAALLSTSSVFSLSNVHLWLQSGYFDVEAQLKPYLHTWSLSVEWQFYLSWALISQYIYANVEGVRNQLYIICAIACLSLFAAEVTRKQFPSAVFYLFFFRYFEFLCGAIPAWKQCNTNNEPLLHNAELKSRLSRRSIVSASCLCGILCLFLFFRDSVPFPGITALPVCTATAVLISYSKNTHSGKLLLNQYFQWLGNISYSVYLVHWPVQVFIHHFILSSTSKTFKFLGLLSSIALGYLLYILVEKQFHERDEKSFYGVRKVRLRILFIFVVVLLLQSLAMQFRNLTVGPTATIKFDEKIKSILERTRELAESRSDEARRKCRSYGRFDNLNHFDECNPPTSTEILLLGDSHAVDMYYALSKTFPNTTTIELAGTSCSLTHVFSKGSRCERVQNAYPSLLKSRQDRIKVCVLVSLWQDKTESELKESHLSTAINYCKTNLSAETFVIGVRPFYKLHPSEVFVRSKELDFERRLKEIHKYMHVDTKVAKKIYKFVTNLGAIYISIPKLLCNATFVGQDPSEYYCPVLSRDESAFIYTDKTHYNRKGAFQVINHLRALLTPLLQVNKTLISS